MPKAQELVALLSEKAIKSYAMPLINIEIGNDIPRLKSILTSVSEETPIFLLSPNIFLYHDTLPPSQAADITQAFTALNAPYFAIGQSTAQKFNALTAQKAHYPKGREISENLILLPELTDVLKNNALTLKSAIIIRGNSGRDIIANHLKNENFEVIEVETYRRVPNEMAKQALEVHLTKDEKCLFVITSGEMLTLLTDWICSNSNAKYDMQQHELLVVSERLTVLASTLGWKNIFLANNANNNDLLVAILEIVSNETR